MNRQGGPDRNLSIQVNNLGKAASGNQGKLVLQCTVLSGGPVCPVPPTTRSLPSIEPGQGHGVQLFGARPAQAGKYRILIEAQPGWRGQSRTVDLDVAAPPGRSIPRPKP